MEALTPAERRGAIVVVGLLALGAVHDLWRASRPLPAPSAGLTGIVATQVEGARAHGAGGDTLHGDWVPASRPPQAIVDINRASAPELDALPGVGPVLAGRIIAHRDRHGPFRHPDELLAVRGIGPRLLAKLRPCVTVVSESAGAGLDRPPRAGPGGLQTAARPAPLRADSGSVHPPPLPITRQD